jgi:hypothetical protein
LRKFASAGLRASQTARRNPGRRKCSAKESAKSRWLAGRTVSAARKSAMYPAVRLACSGFIAQKTKVENQLDWTTTGASGERGFGPERKGLMRRDCAVARQCGAQTNTFESGASPKFTFFS